MRSHLQQNNITQNPRGNHLSYTTKTYTKAHTHAHVHKCIHMHRSTNTQKKPIECDDHWVLFLFPKASHCAKTMLLWWLTVCCLPLLLSHSIPSPLTSSSFLSSLNINSRALCQYNNGLSLVPVVAHLPTIVFTPEFWCADYSQIIISGYLIISSLLDLKSVFEINEWAQCVWA